MNQEACVPKSKIASTVLPAVLAAAAAGEDPWLWLEDVSGEAPLAWVGERNALTVEGYAQGAAFAASRDRFKAILDSDDRIPYVSKHGDAWYNFWRDERNPRGIWRRTTLAEYRKDSPAWEVVLDVDALAEAEGENWVFKGAECRRPDFRRCLVMLSRGGADAVVVREFDLVEKAFVEDGFFLPEAKSGVDWAGPDRLFVGTDFGPGSMTESGYPRIAKAWERGTPLADARVLFEGAVEDVSVSAWADLGEYPREFVGRAIDFWNRETYLYRDGEAVRIDAPTSANISVFRERLFIRLTQDWTVGGETHAAGSFLAADLEEFLAGDRTLETLFAPTPTMSLESVSLTRNHVILTVLDNVVYRLEVLTPGAEGWRRRAMPAGDRYDSAYAVAVDRESSDAYFLHINGYLTPPTLAYGELDPVADGGTAAPEVAVEVLKNTPALFDASGLEVTQHFTTSADGTRVPYFQVRPAGSDGAEPDVALWVRRLRDLHDAGLPGADWGGLAGGGRHLCRREHPGRRRVRAVLASLRPQGEPSARVPGFRRGRRGPDPEGDHDVAPARHHGRQQRRPADGQHAHPPPGTLRRRRRPGAAVRHAPLPRAAGRGELDGRVRRPGRSPRSGRSSAASRRTTTSMRRRTTRRSSSQPPPGTTASIPATPGRWWRSSRRWGTTWTTTRTWKAGTRARRTTRRAPSCGRWRTGSCGGTWARRTATLRSRRCTRCVCLPSPGLVDSVGALARNGLIRRHGAIDQTFPAR